MAQSTVIKIKNRIYGKGKGWVFTPNNFLDLGSDEACRQALSRLVKAGFIRRLAHGLYDYPAKHKTLGILYPSVEAVGKAIAEKHSITIQPSGAYAANRLGLSDQAPAKAIFLTDGSLRPVKIGNLTLTSRKTTPKNMKTAGSTTGLVIQALRYLVSVPQWPSVAIVGQGLCSGVDQKGY